MKTIDTIYYLIIFVPQIHIPRLKYAKSTVIKRIELLQFAKLKTFRRVGTEMRQVTLQKDMKEKNNKSISLLYLCTLLI